MYATSEGRRRATRALPVLPIVFCALLFLTAPARALDVPPLSARVNDAAGRLAPATVQTLEQSLEQLEKSDSTQIAVLIIDSLEGEVLEEFSLKAAETWGLGQKGRDNGALLLVALRDRAVRIEVGHGLEDKLTDLVCGRIIRNEIVPAFREGDFDRGVTAGVAAMTRAVRGAYQAEEDEAATEHLTWDEALLFFALVGWLCGQIVGTHPAVTAIVGGLASLSFGLWLEEPPLGVGVGVVGGAAGGALAPFISLVRIYFPETRITPLNQPFYLFLSVLLFCLDCLKHPVGGGGGRGSGGGFSGGGGGFGGGGASGRW